LQRLHSPGFGWPANRIENRIANRIDIRINIRINNRGSNRPSGRKVENRDLSDKDKGKHKDRPSGAPAVREKKRGLLYAWRLLRQLPFLRLRYKL